MDKSIILSFALTVFINLTIINYVKFTEKASPKCSDIPENDILEFSTYILLALNVSYIVSPRKYLEFLLANPMIKYLALGLGLLRFVTLFRYITAMKEAECEQSTEHWRRKVLYYYSRVMLILFILTAVASIFLFSRGKPLIS